ncbi:anthranilate synthase component I family protein [Microbacterium halophytorum]|uniref:anthranilate synthase component I family protein n=1 Tax=Microbacterium halophytorum TaxID=2067568 RepID=UPI001E2C4575|nr:anthranilate synthase component I family protein [Microbacterium halophytorum]
MSEIGGRSRDAGAPGVARGGVRPDSGAPMHGPSPDDTTRETWVSLTRRVAGAAADPAALFASLYGDRPIAVWLDSARSAYGMGRWSIMGAPETDRDDVLEAGDAVWEVLTERIAAHPVDPIGELPFAGGYVGCIGYDAKAIGRVGPSDGPPAQLVHLSRFVVLDHETGDAIAVAVGPERELPDARAWVEDVARRVAEPVRRPVGAPPGTARAVPVVARTSVSRERYLADLAEVRRWLYDGDSYEACYTYNLRLPFTGDGLAAYLRLRSSNPAPNAAFLRLPGREVLSCSPERYLRVGPDGLAETKPIKGTARRESDPADDALAAERLAADPKTRAENLMIVDLMRNDLVPVSEPGSVEVPRLMAVESYETVHQLVTTISSRLRPREAAGVRAARALFPPGSMTGAPKQRTVELLDGLEAEPRGVYSGVLGLFSRDGAVDLSVVIRTAVVEAGAVTIGTGGAITFDSDPEAELRETVAKSGPIVRAFGAAHPFEA